MDSPVQYEALRMTPTVSIVLPTYNRANLLERSILSLSEQTYKDFEIIVVDDGSEDDTHSLVKKLRKNDSRIIYVRHFENKGANAARNTGLLKARGKFIGFQDSDDIWLPEKLAIQMEAISNTTIRAIFTGFWRIQGGKKKYLPKKGRKIKTGVHSFYESLLEGNFIALPTFIAEKKLIMSVGGFDETLPRLQDWDLFLRISKNAEMLYIDQPLVEANLEGDNISLKSDLYEQALLNILGKYERDFNKFPAAFVIQSLNLIINSITNGRLNKGFVFSLFFSKKHLLIEFIKYKILRLK